MTRLEEDMREERAARARLEFAVLEVRTMQTRQEAAILEVKTILLTTLPHLATKADVADAKSELRSEVADCRVEVVGCRTEVADAKSELKLDIARLDADKPGKAYMWGILAVLLTAYACGLAGLAVLKSSAAPSPTATSAATD